MKYKLPKEFAKKWVDALRSGEYKQGRGYLYNYGCYCCLGVAAKVCGIDDKELIGREYLNRTSIIESELIPHVLCYSKADSSLIAELTDRNDEILISDSSHVYNFNRIASWIEENVEFI